MSHPVPLILEERVEVFSQDLLSERIGDQNVEVPTPQIVEELVEVVPQDRLSERVGDKNNLFTNL